VIFLLYLLWVGVVFVLTNTATDAAKRTVFHPPVLEEQTLAWLKERNHDAESLGNGRYRIYWRDYSGNNLRDKYGALYSIRTFDWGPRGDIADALVSSSVEIVKTGEDTTSSQGLPRYRYHYHVKSLETSRQPIVTFRIFTRIPKNWKRDISDPLGWSNGGQPSQTESASNHVRWIHRGKDGIYGLYPGQSQSGFGFQCQGVPGILTADIWTTGRDMKGMEEVKTLHYTETAPRGPVIGPVAIPVGTSVLELARRLETLTSQSVELEWLDASAAASLRKHLEEVFIALGKNQQSAAKRALGAFVATLEELRKSTTTKQRDKLSPSSAGVEAEPLQEPVIIAEALTLLKTNAAYLLTRF